MANPFQQAIEESTGRRLTSGYRSQEEQDALVARGVTRAKQSSHSRGTPDNPGGFDLSGDKPGQEADVKARIEATGRKVSRVIWESGKGANQGTGPHYHVELVDDGKSGGGGGAGGSTNPNDRYQSPVALTEVPASGSGRPNAPDEVGNPFTAGAETNRRAGVVQDALTKQGVFVNRQEQEVNALQESRRERLEQSVAQKREVVGDIIDANKKTVADIAPTQEYLDKLSAQRLRIATMNPLERGIKGIFDLNYNDKYLKQVNDDVKGILAEQVSRHTMAQTLRTEYLRALDEDSNASAELENLKTKELDEDAAVINQQVGFASASLMSLSQANQASDSLIQSQIFRTNKALDDMTTGDVAAALNSAKMSPTGVAVVGGVPISVGQLQHKNDNIKRQAIALESAQIAIEAGRMDLADKHMENLVDSMSPTQLAQVAADGGVYKGMKIPNSILTRGLNTMNARQQAVVGAMIDRSAPRQIEMGVREFASQVKTAQQRFGSLGVGKSTATAIAKIQTDLAAGIETYAGLAKQGMGGGVAAQIATKQIQEARTKLENLTTGLVNQFAGSNTNTAAVLKAYVLGHPVSADAANQMFMDFVKEGGMPMAMTTTPGFQAAFDEYRRATDSVNAEIATRGLKVSAGEKRKMVVDRARVGVGAALNKANFNEFYKTLPQAAKKIGDPFGALPQKEWDSIRIQAKNAAYADAARQLRVTPDELVAYYTRNQIPQSVDPAGATEWAKQANGMKAGMGVTENKETLELLDQSSIASTAFRPSAAFVDFVTSPQFTDLAGLYQHQQGNFSFGDFTASALRGQGIIPGAAEFGAKTHEVSLARSKAIRDQGRTASKSYMENTGVRTRAIIGALPGLNESEEAMLYRAVTDGLSPAQLGFGVAGENTNDLIRSRIVDSKFDNPALERVRKIAAKSWDERSQTLDKAYGRMNMDWNISRSAPVVGALNTFLIRPIREAIDPSDFGDGAQ